MMAELETLAGELVEFELLRYEPPPREIDMGLYRVLARVMRETDPKGVPVPYVLARAETDARFFARLGIQTYGFLPMHLPPALNFRKLIHAADERIPAEALDSGATRFSRYSTASTRLRKRSQRASFVAGHFLDLRSAVARRDQATQRGSRQGVLKISQKLYCRK
jgi:acetylornithine deacetylase/succinyl-diaminopimelate desuccinylase-like protein